VAWAEDEEDFIMTVAAIFERRSWTILSVHQCQRACECTAMTAELSDQIEEAERTPGSCIFGMLHYYPSRPA
jgi:2-oxo-4-hydroxy-4-carboxy--5-ureidoimidazoline (OHCU) decarboxylase